MGEDFYKNLFAKAHANFVAEGNDILPMEDIKTLSKDPTYIHEISHRGVSKLGNGEAICLVRSSHVKLGTDIELAKKLGISTVSVERIKRREKVEIGIILDIQNHTHMPIDEILTKSNYQYVLAKSKGTNLV